MFCKEMMYQQRTYIQHDIWNMKNLYVFRIPLWIWNILMHLKYKNRMFYFNVFLWHLHVIRDISWINIHKTDGNGYLLLLITLHKNVMAYRNNKRPSILVTYIQNMKIKLINIQRQYLLQTSILMILLNQDLKFKKWPCTSDNHDIPRKFV